MLDIKMQLPAAATGSPCLNGLAAAEVSVEKTVGAVAVDNCGTDMAIAYTRYCTMAHRTFPKHSVAIVSTLSHRRRETVNPVVLRWM